jgi:hypothetical protein
VIQPQGQTVSAGGDASFVVGATGTDPLAFQWRLNGADLTGATSTNLTLTNIQSADAGDYAVVAANACGSVTGTVAYLLVTQPGVPASITVQPQSRTNVVGTTATFTVRATGTAPLTYQWRFNNATLAGATSTNLVFSAVQLGDAGDYCVVAANVRMIDDAVAAHTGAALQTQVDVAPVGDVTGEETRVGTFAFSQPEFRVLEDGLPLAAVTVTRTDGNKGAVGLRIALSDGTARFADGDYAGTSLYLQLGDGEISQTVNFAAVLNDDAEVETDETLVLTLSLQAGAPPGAQIGAQNQTVLIIVDNE